jgi:hypothetical protein
MCKLSVNSLDVIVNCQLTDVNTIHKKNLDVRFNTLTDQIEI